MLDFPHHLDIESTNACQLKCSICPRHKMTRPVGFMEWDLFKKIIDEAKGYTKTAYLHQIGEPLLHQKIIKFIDYAADAEIKPSISTNAIALDEKIGAELLNSKLHELSLAIDALDPDTYSKMREGGDFFKTMFNIQRFLEMARGHKLLITIQLIKTIFNRDSIYKWESYFKEKAKGCNFEILTKDFSTFAGNVADVGTESKPLRFKCRKAWHVMTINYDGSVVLCCRDYNKFTVIGDANIDSLSAIWYGDTYREIREDFKDKRFPDFCKNC